MHRPSAALGTALLIATALSLAGCSTPAQDTPATASAAEPAAAATAGSANQADVEFAQMMIVHHQGALDMARLAAGRAGSPKVAELARRIEAAQQPEIETMTGWLDQWGAEPLAEAGAMPGMDHGSMTDTDAGGMASDADMRRLAEASGPQFDAAFLDLMTVHHQGAVAMAQTEVEDGRNGAAVDLARRVIADQTAEIELMGQLLASD